ncbi:MAG: hypothetical protein R3292_04075 [Alcanivorax sp.]|nr:hypothetical protein [Alcanivorax sp.]
MIRQSGFGCGIKVGPLEYPWFQWGLAAPGADQVLLESGLLKFLQGMGQFRQAQAGGVIIFVAINVADDLSIRLVMLLHPCAVARKKRPVPTWLDHDGSGLIEFA